MQASSFRNRILGTEPPEEKREPSVFHGGKISTGLCSISSFRLSGTQVCTQHLKVQINCFYSVDKVFGTGDDGSS